MFKSNPVLDNGTLWGFNQMQQRDQLECEATAQMGARTLRHIVSYDYYSSSFGEEGLS